MSECKLNKNLGNQSNNGEDHNARMKEASKRWEGLIKKGHMALPINGQSTKRLESIPNQVHTVFGWELKIIDLRVYLKNC